MPLGGHFYTAANSPSIGGVIARPLIMVLSSSV